MWYHHLEHGLNTMSLHHFIELVNIRLGPPLHSNPLGELVSLRKTGSISEFLEQFLALHHHTNPLSEQQQRLLFTVGLGGPLKIDVEPQALQSLEMAMSLARGYERRA